MPSYVKRQILGLKGGMKGQIAETKRVLCWRSSLRFIDGEDGFRNKDVDRAEREVTGTAVERFQAGRRRLDSKGILRVVCPRAAAFPLRQAGKTRQLKSQQNG